MKMIQNLNIIKAFIRDERSLHQLCWCGSEKKFKDCHLKRKEQHSLNQYQMAKNFQKIDQSFKLCLFNSEASPCQGIIKNAHSISKKLFLDKISHKNHVYSIEFDFKINKAIAKNIGINQASTFFGFCDFHDNILFECFEKNDFNYSLEQLFMLAYRSLCLEIFKKKSVEKKYFAMKYFIDNGENIEIQFFKQLELNKVITKNKNSINTLETIKTLLNNYIIEKEFKYLNHCIINLSEIQPLLASTLISPEFDFNSNKVQDLESTNEIKNLFMNSLIIDNKGFILISWIKNDNNYLKKILDSILLSSSIGKSLTTLFLAYSENIFLNPSYYSSLNENDKLEFNKIINYHNDFDKNSPQNNLKLDFFNYKSHTYLIS